MPVADPTALKTIVEQHFIGINYWAQHLISHASLQAKVYAITAFAISHYMANISPHYEVLEQSLLEYFVELATSLLDKARAFALYNSPFITTQITRAGTKIDDVQDSATGLYLAGSQISLSSLWARRVHAAIIIQHRHRFTTRRHRRRDSKAARLIQQWHYHTSVCHLYQKCDNAPYFLSYKECEILAII